MSSLIDYSESDFIAWNLERERHLQTIDHLRSRIEELTAERERNLEEIAILKQTYIEATCRDGYGTPGMYDE